MIIFLLCLIVILLTLVARTLATTSKDFHLFSERADNDRAEQIRILKYISDKLI